MKIGIKEEKNSQKSGRPQNQELSSGRELRLVFSPYLQVIPLRQQDLLSETALYLACKPSHISARDIALHHQTARGILTVNDIGPLLNP